MAEKLDATSRLAEGRPSVDNVQNYVSACHLLGYQNPDLTLHAAQVRDWYASEDGLDLSALQADCAAFDAVVAATERALVQQDDQLGAMPAAWSGYGAEASQAFLRRHGEASATVAAAVRTAADALRALRDRLWQTVDEKVDAVIAIEDRRTAQRAEWLAAAQTVMTGAGDRAAASELIDQQVKPFVDNDIRADWLTAMRAAMAAVTNAYDAAAAELTAEPVAVFDVPGDLGPSWTPPPPDDDLPGPTGTATVPAPVTSAPASWSAAPAPAPSSVAPASMPSAPAPPAPLPEAATAPAMAAPPMPSLGGMGGGLPDIGSGLSGLGQQLGETLGGLFGSAEGALADPPELEEPDLLDEESEADDELEDDEPEDPQDDEASADVAEDEEAGVEEIAGTGDPAADTVDACADEAAAVPGEAPPPAAPVPPPEPAPTPAPMPPPPEPLPPSDPMAATETPCEIAADELPQVGQ